MARDDKPTAAFWREAGGRSWAAQHDLLDRIYAPIGEIIADRAGVGQGARVLDVGCGTGATTISMARRVGASGHCTGVDVSDMLIDIAGENADGLTSIEFIRADAEDYPFDADAYDAVTSRFGVMFFASPQAAFANLHRATKADGRLAFASWRSAAENPMAQLPMQAAAPFLSDLPPSPPPYAPGRFAFADPDHVRCILQASGWRNIDFAQLDAPTPLTFDEAMRLHLELGALAPILRQQTEPVRQQITEAVRARLQTHVEDGVVPMNSACWLVTASA